MTVEEAQKLKAESEDKILDIIRDLQTQTGCEVKRISFESEQVSTSLGALMHLTMEVKIDLRIK